MANPGDERIPVAVLGATGSVGQRFVQLLASHPWFRVAELVASGLASWSEDQSRRPVLIVRGQANLIDETSSEDLERVRLLLDELEKRQEIARVLEGARDAPGCRIFIGSENRMFALSGSSVIAAPYRGSQGQVVGVVGVIGPTRLNYARVVPMVDFTAKALTRLMA